MPSFVFIAGTTKKKKKKKKKNKIANGGQRGNYFRDNWTMMKKQMRHEDAGFEMAKDRMIPIVRLCFFIERLLVVFHRIVDIVVSRKLVKFQVGHLIFLIPREKTIGKEKIGGK